MKKIITALLNNQINEELRKDKDLQVIGNDYMYQEAVIETIEENDDIDYLLLNENLPGEEIEKFIAKIPQVKTIIFTEKSRKKGEFFEIKGAYKTYQNGEIGIDEIKEIIKQTNYTDELEKEIKKLKKQIKESQEQKTKQKIKIPDIIRFSKKNKNSQIIRQRIEKDKIQLEITIKIL